MNEVVTQNPISREKIMQLEQAISELPDQIDLDPLTSHYFAPGIYLRELFIPAGTALVGKIHRHELMNILVSGTIRVTTDDGVQEFTGPKIYNSAAGSKKAGLALTDTIWINIHPTTETDLAKIEEEFIAPSFEELEHSTKELEKAS